MKNDKWIVFLALVIAAASFRIAVAHWLPNDGPDDGRIYAQMARNVLEQHVYSHATEPPYDPSLIRLPGYPLFLAAIYSVFGHGNNGAVRIVQALIDTGTCALIGLLAFCWQPDPKKKKMSSIAALALAAICPFTTIYVATILTETLTMFLLLAMLVTATLALRKTLTTEDTEEVKKAKTKTALAWWCVTGLIGGLAVLMRPDAGLFVAAVGITLVIAGLRLLVFDPGQRPKTKDQNPLFKRFALRVLLPGTVLTLAFAMLLVPWTIRNWRVFHLFQPLAPAHAEMPGEFVPRGYLLWLRTWLDDEDYVAPFLWSLDTDPIDIDDVPASAYDSAEEKTRIAALLDKYNHADEAETTDTTAPSDANEPLQARPSPSPGASPSPPPSQTPTSTPNGNQAAESADEDKEEESSENDSGDSANQEPGSVEMTPDIDAGFAQLAHDHISRHPFRFYVWLPLKRAHSMWFNTHSQYWPFEGSLMPLEDLDYAQHQQIWLPLFAGLTVVYTLAGLAGIWLLWGYRKFAGRLWVVLAGVGILLRVILFARMENPEPRYLVEFFPILSVLGGIAIADALSRLRRA